MDPSVHRLLHIKVRRPRELLNGFIIMGLNEVAMQIACYAVKELNILRGIHPLSNMSPGAFQFSSENCSLLFFFSL